MTKRKRYCVICDELIQSRRHKFCSDSCRDEYNRRQLRDDREERERQLEIQRQCSWDYDENDTYYDEEDFLYRDGTDYNGNPNWKDMRKR